MGMPARTCVFDHTKRFKTAVHRSWASSAIDLVVVAV